MIGIEWNSLKRRNVNVTGEAEEELECELLHDLEIGLRVFEIREKVSAKVDECVNELLTVNDKRDSLIVKENKKGRPKLNKELSVDVDMSIVKEIVDKYRNKVATLGKR